MLTREKVPNFQSSFPQTKTVVKLCFLVNLYFVMGGMRRQYRTDLTHLSPLFPPKEVLRKKQKSEWPHGQPCLMPSESKEEGCQAKTYFSNLSRGLLGLEVPFGIEGTGKGFVTSPADPWKRTEIKLVREICLYWNMPLF